MQLETAIIDDVRVVRCAGRLDATSADAAQRHLLGLLDGGASKLVVDFADVDFISSAGLRVLLAVVKRLRGSAGALHISGLRDTVHDVFEMSGFTTLMSIFPNETDAVRGF